MWWRSLLALGLATQAVADIDGAQLGDRIVTAQNVIWPEEVFDAAFDGCFLILRQASSQTGSDETENRWWLADFVTEPGGVFRNGQKMTDGAKTWEDISVYYPLRPERQSVNRDHIAAYNAALDQVDAADEGTVGWFGIGRKSEAEIETMLRKIYDDRQSGIFGPLLQRNIGWATGNDPEIGRYFHPYGLIDTSLGFVFRDDVIDELVSDIHQYRLENCPEG